MAFSDNLNWIMDYNRLTVSDLEKKAGIGKSLLYKYLQNYTQPKIDNVIQIANALECSLDLLCGKFEDKSKLLKLYLEESENKRQQGVIIGNKFKDLKFKLIISKKELMMIRSYHNLSEEAKREVDSILFNPDKLAEIWPDEN